MNNDNVKNIKNKTNICKFQLIPRKQIIQFIMKKSTT